MWALAETDPIPLIGTDAWWSEFTRSPGLAGTLAVLAAVVGLIGVGWNHRAARAAKRRDRWWEMFQAVSKEIATYSDARATMVVEALRDEAETKFEKQMVASLADALLPPAQEQRAPAGLKR